MVASGQTLIAVTAQLPWAAHPYRPAVPRARSGGRVPRRDRIRIAVGRLARRAGAGVSFRAGRRRPTCTAPSHR